MASSRLYLHAYTSCAALADEGDLSLQVNLPMLFVEGVNGPGLAT